MPILKSHLNVVIPSGLLVFNILIFPCLEVGAIPYCASSMLAIASSGLITPKKIEDFKPSEKKEYLIIILIISHLFTVINAIFG